MICTAEAVIAAYRMLPEAERRIVRKAITNPFGPAREARSRHLDARNEALHAFIVARDLPARTPKHWSRIAALFGVECIGLALRANNDRERIGETILPTRYVKPAALRKSYRAWLRIASAPLSAA
jgi:hypothetical protein